MAEKVLVADDSLTIQKVVGITLADTSYEVDQCLNEEELFQKIESNYYNLILLDFNFSEGKSGYELAQAVAGSSPNSAILAMLGTFDTVDDSELTKSGVVDKVVKPFESDKFIAKCQQLVEMTSEGELDSRALEEKPVSENVVVEEAEEELALGEDWVVDSPQPEDNSSAFEEEEVVVEVEEEQSLEYAQEDNQQNALSAEMEGWGMQVPGVIGEEKAENFGIFPPVIEDTPEQNIEAVSLEEGTDTALQLEEEGEVEPTSQFISTDDLAPTDEDTSFAEETDPHIQMPEQFTAELAAEIEELGSPDDFWAVEGAENKAEPTQGAMPKTDDEVRYEETAKFVENPDLIDVNSRDNVQPMAQPAAMSSNPVDEKAMVEQITNTITPMIEEMVRHFCQQKIEQVAWEVIPDLAENIIKKELKDIADSVRS